MSEFLSGLEAEFPKSAIEKWYDEFDCLIETLRFYFITEDLTVGLNDFIGATSHHRINMMKHLMSEVHRLLSENQTVEDRGLEILDIYEGLLRRYEAISREFFGDCNDCNVVLTEPGPFVCSVEYAIEDSASYLNPGRDVSEAIMTEVDGMIEHVFEHAKK